MPKYHFIGNGKRLLAEYKGDRTFVESMYYNDSGESVVVKNVGGSLAFVSLASGLFLNKLHVGQLFSNNPHVEVYSKNGLSPRVDLHDLGLQYALLRLEELKRWRDPEHREKMRDHYYRATTRGYSRPKLLQLTVTEEVLEQKICMHERMLENLSSRTDSEYVFQDSTYLETCAGNLVTVMNSVIEALPKPETRKKQPRKELGCSIAIEIAEEIQARLDELLQHINSRADFATARTYWDDVVDWSDKSRYNFIGCIPGTKEHVMRHIEGSGLIGSGFFKDFIPRFFPSMDSLLYYGIQQTKERNFHGAPVIVERRFPEPIGFNSVVALKDLPPNVKVERRMREQFEVNVVTSIERTLTNRMFIILAPWLRNEYGVHTMYPGERPAPMLTDVEYWKDYAFIESS